MCRFRVRNQRRLEPLDHLKPFILALLIAAFPKAARPQAEKRPKDEANGPN
jgi:hypothetical protein